MLLTMPARLIATLFAAASFAMLLMAMPGLAHAPVGPWMVLPDAQPQLVNGQAHTYAFTSPDEIARRMHSGAPAPQPHAPGMVQVSATVLPTHVIHVNQHGRVNSMQSNTRSTDAVYVVMQAERKIQMTDAIWHQIQALALRQPDADGTVRFADR